MKIAIVAFALIVGGVTNVLAGEAAVEQIAPGDPFDWSGIHVGAHLGHGWSNTDFTDVDGWNVEGEVFGGNSNGFIGGVQAGYSFQSGSFVYGAEVELGYLGIDETFVQPSSPADSFASIDGGFYAALTARLGYAADRTLFFAKGGVAYLNADVNFDDDCKNDGPCGIGLVNASGGNFTGWTLGAGVEHALTDRWTARVEYAYYDFGTATASSQDGWTRYDADLTTHAVKVGLNYKF